MNARVEWLCPLLAIAFCMLLAGGASAAGVEEAVTIPLQPYVGRLVTAVAIAGGDTLTLLLDTGGGSTLISPDVAKALGCNPKGRDVGFRMSGERVEFAGCENITMEIGGRRFVHKEIGVWDIMSILPDGLPALDGVLALDTFHQQPFTLDLEGRELTLETIETLDDRIRGMKEIEARVSTGPGGGELTFFVRGVLGEPGWFLFDSGNLDVIQVAPHMIGESGAVPRVMDPVNFELPGLPPMDVSIKVADIIYDGALAESFLRNWIWTFDPAAGRLWAAASP